MSRSDLGNYDLSNPRLKNALDNWQQWSVEAPSIIRKLDGGLTNEAYLIQSKDKHYVLRLNSPNSRQLGLDRKLEFQALRQASKFRLAPEIIFCNPEKDVLITEFIPGNFWNETDFQSIDNIHHLVKLINSIHQLPAINGTLDFTQRIQHYWQSIDSDNALSSQLKKIDPQIHFRIEEAQSHNPEPCFCHNDLLASNLVTINNQNLIAIDWEYAAMGDPYFELAVIAEGNLLDESTINILLAAYVGYDDDAVCNPIDISLAKQRLSDNRAIYCYLDLLWYAIQYGNNNSGRMKKLLQMKLKHLQQTL